MKTKTEVKKMTDKIKSFKDCRIAIGKTVEFKHRGKTLIGIAEKFEKEGRTVWFSIRHPKGWLVSVESSKINR